MNILDPKLKPSTGLNSILAQDKKFNSRKLENFVFFLNSKIENSSSCLKRPNHVHGRTWMDMTLATHTHTHFRHFLARTLDSTFTHIVVLVDARVHFSDYHTL